MDKRLFNVVQLGIGFLLVFAAFNSSGFVEELALNKIHNISLHDSSVADVNPKSGYYSLAIIYAVFTLANFAAPPVVNAMTPKWAMVAGAVCYAIMMAGFLHVMEWFLYLSSALVGLGAAIIWTGQGNYLTLNSDAETIGRNSGIVWAIMQSAPIIGGIFLYFAFGGKSDIDIKTIRVIYGAFTGMAVLGIIVLAFLRKAPKHQDTPSRQNDQDMLVESISAENPAVIDSVQTLPKGEPVRRRPQWLTDFLRTFELLFTREMGLLAVVFLYTGLETTFWTGVYGACLGFTNRIPNRNQIVALNAIFIGIGEAIGGGIFGLFGSRFNKFGRNPVIILGSIAHMVAFFLIFVNLPKDAPLGATDGEAYIHPNEYLALFCSFLLGFSDACWNTQIYSLLGSLYPDDSAPAFALYKFFQSASACGSFYYGSVLYLHWQLMIMAIGAFIAALCFFPVEWIAQTRPSGLKIAW